MAKTSDGNLHLVYEDDRKIYYSYSDDNGTNWSDEELISTGGICVYPSIAAHANTIYVAWTNEIGSGSIHSVYHRQKETNWLSVEVAADIVIQESFQDITAPVVAAFNDNGIIKPVIVVRDFRERGHNNYYPVLVSFMKDNGQWNEINLDIIGQNPSLCADSHTNSDYNVLGLAFDDSGNIFYCELTTSGSAPSWGELVTVSSGSGEEKNPSLSLMNGNAHIVWEGYNNEDSRDEIYYRELTNGNTVDYALPGPSPYPGSGHGNPIIVSGPTTADAYNPSIGVASNNDVAFFYNKDGEIFKKKREGSTWKLYDYNQTGQYPSIIQNGLKRAVYTKYTSAPYLLKSLYTEPSSGGIWNPVPIPGIVTWNGHTTESAIRLDYPIDSLQNGGSQGYITLDVLNVSFVEDSLGMNQGLQSDTMLLANNLLPLEIDLHVRFINVNNGFDDNTVLLRADFMENDQSVFLTDLRYHDLPAAAGDSLERFIKIATIVNLAGHEGNLQLRFSDVEPDMYIIQNEDVEALQKSVDEGFTHITPEKYMLHQNFPNPFNPITHITFELPKEGDVQLDIFNIKGERVSSLISGHCNEGIYEVLFDGSALASGVYFYRLEAKGFVQTRRMLLLK